MDEVDIDNVEDLNELEARLYAQIHHEATDVPLIENRTQHPGNYCGNEIVINVHNPEGSERNYETSSNTNRILSRRYWAGGEHAAKQHNQDRNNYPKQHFIRNPFKTPNNHGRIYSDKSQNQQQHSQQIGNTSNNSSNSSKEKKTTTPTQNNSKSHIANKSNTKLTSKTDPKSVDLSPSLNNENKETENGCADQQSVVQNTPTEKSNLKLNPVADWMNRKKKQINKKAIGKNNNVNNKKSKNSSINIKQGLFSRQQQKLERAKRIEEKKQRSKNAKNSATAIGNNVKPTEIIVLDSDNESDSSDIVMIPIAAPPTYTVDDSPDEETNNNEDLITMEHEENALDSTDVQMCSTTSSFIKPQAIITQSFVTVDGVEKRLENLSRCTSPCSIQSSDDFIGQSDRCRLLEGASGTADDEDLLVLTSDISSLLEVPDISKHVVDKLDKANPLHSMMQQVCEENIETTDSLEFATPNTSKPPAQPKDYRVDQGQFRALDVYESESDITDNIYSKGANKSTVIRQIDTSSDEVEDISSCSQRTKRFHKRRASSSNKESDPNNGNSASSSDNENIEDDNAVLRTKIPFIAKGPAVERYKPRKRSHTLLSCSPIRQKRKSTNTTFTEYMSDTDFIATLNNLAQGQDGEQVTQNLEVDEESETENVPTAREIAEKILVKQTASEKNQTDTDDMAIPDNIIDELEKVFETIDNFDKDGNQLSAIDDIVKISDSSDSDREKHFIYKSLPDEKAHIIEYSPNKSNEEKSPAKTHADNGSPIYNVMYIRGTRKPNGIGWNDEMKKFYNNSWNGEHFMLSKVLQKMNPDKRLWKIYTEDRFNIKSNKRSNIKCMNCCEFGHMRSKCKRPKKPLICYMCGESGHYEPRCPNTICLRCGNKTQVFTKCCNACSYQNRLTCPICKIRGHSLDYCPDKWRRYHSTTEANVHPNSKIDYNPRKYCCICGARGHISDNCRSAVRFSEYPPFTSSIKSHQKSYNDVVIRTPYNGIAVNLMYKPCQEYKLDLVELTSIEKYYGRFLKAVGMDYLFKRKRPLNTMSIEIADTSVKRTKRLSKKYEANPYSKVGTATQQNTQAMESAPNQVQEITESGNTDQQNEETYIVGDSINIDEKSDNEVELSGHREEEDAVENMQLSTIKQNSHTGESHNGNFKSPKKITSTPTPGAAQKSVPEKAVVLDSDSNYSFSEHFDLAPSSSNVSTLAETPTTKETPTLVAETSNGKEHETESFVTANSRPKAREMETLPDFIPLNDSTPNQNEARHGNYEKILCGISRRFVAANSDEDDDNRRDLRPLTELPCEAKIYLTHFHSKYLLSPQGNAFLAKTSRTHKLKARLDFTSVGHVLVIFGLPSNQDQFQRELLLKYRDLEDERNQKQPNSSNNVPKRTYVLIRFLRENINQLMTNLGNANSLLNRLQYHERQHTKSGNKLAEKVRRSLNMILVGQAGLQDGILHLDKLLISLKTLLNNVSDDVAPPEIRSEITNHWKYIFSSYRHDNYRQLVDTYNRLVSKNRMPQLNIDPILLGQKVLDTSFSEEQKEKLDQARPPALTNTIGTNRELSKQIAQTSSNEKNAKFVKRKQNGDTTSPSNSSGSNTRTANKTKTTASRLATPTNFSQNATPKTGAESSNSLSNVKTKSSNTNTANLMKTNKSPGNTSAAAETNASSSVAPKRNKAKQSASITNATKNTNENSKKQQKIMPPPPFSNPEKRSTVSTSIQAVTDKWKSTCDTLLTEITSEKPIPNKNLNGGKLPSTFWSRESMRYLDDCIRLSGTKSQVVEKLQRVQNKSKNGQLSYNDYLAVIKLHTALNGK